LRITSVTATVLTNPKVSEIASDSSQDNILVEIGTDEGIVGVGEVDASPTVIKALIEMPSSHDSSLGLKSILLGQDPLQVEKLWSRMYEGTIAQGRRGIGIMAIGAVDIALWDIAGKYYGQPVWKLLGGLVREEISPYASLPPLQDPRDIELAELRRMMDYVKGIGFKAVKVEELVNSHPRDYQLVQAARSALGEETELMIDAYYCWPDFKTAYRRCKELEEFNLYFIETPLPVDDVRGLGRLCEKLRMRVATGERLTTRYEFIDLMDRTKIDVIQPDIGRAGGLTESKRIADHAKTRGVSVIPHCWRTGIGVAVSVQFSAATSNCPYFEYVPSALSRSLLRRSLVKSEFAIKDGLIQPPDRPGLGIDIDYDTVEKCKVGP
jgi:L-alanine-DL-glutamate epimerase-like enolase superfamily enzyme